MRSLCTAAATGLASILPGDTACSRAFAAAVAATASAPHPDAALIEIGECWRQARRNWRDIGTIPEVRPGPGGTHDQAGDAIGDRVREMRHAAAAISAQSLAGLVVKARILAIESECSAAEAITDAEIMAWAERTAATEGGVEQAAASPIADLLRMSGVACQ